MKHLNIYLLFTFFLSINYSNAQTRHFFDELSPETQTDINSRLENNLKSNVSGSFRDLKYVPVAFTIFHSEQSYNWIKEQKVLDMFCKMNETFLDQNIQFYLSSEFRYLPRNLLEEDILNGISLNKLELQKLPNTINFYLFEDSFEPLGAYSGTLYKDMIILPKWVIDDKNKGVGHQLGHFFSLKHTYHGWEACGPEQYQNGDTISSSFCDPSLELELVDGSNCFTAGDQICDTPPDYFFGWLMGEDCPPYNFVFYDVNGDTIPILQYNFMNAFIGCENNTYTPGQKEIIHADLDSPHRDYLDNNFSPGIITIPSLVNYLSPSQGSEVNTSDDVLLDWEALPGALYYVVEYSYSNFSANSTTSTIVSSDSLILNSGQLQPNRNYRWRVSGFNQVNTCADFINESDFKTGLLANHYTHSDFQYNIVPNPIENDQNVKISLITSTSFECSVNILDPNGKSLYSIDKIKFEQGKNEHIIHLNNLKSGFYLISITTDGRSSVKKLVVL